jgi:7-carboxy-7-deazaguanine synthase
MIVNEIFTSIEGEGIRAGRLCTFIRFTGCNLRCSWCDTRYAFEEGREMSVAEILDSVPADARRVTVTGGEPLLQDEASLMDLTDSFIARGTEVNFETNGSVDYTGFMKEGTIITADYKLPSSGMSAKMDMEALSKLRGCDVLKFVAADDADLAATEKVLDSLRPVCHVFISPVFGRMDPKRLVEWLKGYAFKDRMDIRIQIQLHKAVWPPDARGV